MKIRAAVLHKQGQPFQIETLSLEKPRQGEVLVKIGAAGVCHCDYHLVTGASKPRLPIVPGHEGAGEVVEIGPGVTQLKPGDLVALNWAPSCGRCEYCLQGHPALCNIFTSPILGNHPSDNTPRLSKAGDPVYHYAGVSCFAEYAVLPQEGCIPIPKEIPFAVASMLGCSVSTGIGAVFHVAKVRPGSSVIVYGAGGVGLNIIMAAQLVGATQIIVIDQYQSKLDFAQSLGATDILLSGSEIPQKVKALTAGDGARYVFEATGVPGLQEQCLEVVKPGGDVILAGFAPVGSTIKLPGAIITRREVTIRGTYYGGSVPARDFPIYVDLYLQGKLPLDRLLTKTYALEEINQAYDDLIGGEIIRGTIQFETQDKKSTRHESL